MKTPTKLITALALAGIAVAGGAAFTATGVINTDHNAQFLGGAVDQHVSGAMLDSVTYGFDSDDPAHQYVQTVTVVFADNFPDAVDVSLDVAGLDAGTEGTFGPAVSLPASTNTADASDRTALFTWVKKSGSNQDIRGFDQVTDLTIGVTDGANGYDVTWPAE